MTAPHILIIDLGSQYTLVIARTLRELGYRSVVLSPEKSRMWLSQNTPKAIIISGSDKSVTDEHAALPPEEIFDAGVPILGICFGMQWLAHHFGGTVIKDHENIEYGPADITITEESELFRGAPTEQNVWASHGDSVTKVPENFEVTATSTHGTSAMENVDKNIYAVQYHPEVAHTEHGKTLLENFVAHISECEKDWDPEKIIENVQKELNITDETRAIIGFSGGVDSTVAAAMLAPVMGERLLGIFIDAGHMREGEREQVQRHADAAGVTLKIVDAEEDCLALLKDTTDAEEKRAAFKKIYLSTLMNEAKEFSANTIVQGTLATDLIESGAEGGVLIKSHHNVNLDFDHLTEMQPLASLFKYEVRAIAESLKLPETVTNREPFPGPGLYMRVIGGIVTAERLDTVRWADTQVRSVVASSEDIPQISQLVVCLLATPTTGVKGDARTYASSIVIRAIHTTDFMTADAVMFPSEFRKEITRALTKHPDIVRVFWDETPKPPATVEFE